MLLRFATRNLARTPRRTAAVILTVMLGTGSLFIFHGFNSGIMNQYRDNTIHARFGYGQVQTRGYRDRVFERPWEHWIEKPEALYRELLLVDGVTRVFPRMEFSALLSHDQVTVAGRGQGVDGPRESAFFNTMNFVEGRNLAAERDGMVVGLGLARGLGVQVGDPVAVLVRGVDGVMKRGILKVSGVFHTGLKEFDDSAFRLPLAMAQSLVGTPRVEAIALGLENIEDFGNVTRFLRATHPELEAVPFSVLDKIYYQHSVDWLDAQFGVIQIIIVGIVVLGIFNTVSTGILERKQEVGNLRANGESRGEVMALLVLEGLMQGVIGALLGIALALALNSTLLAGGIYMPPAPGITRQFHVAIELTSAMALKTMLLGILAVCLGTLAASIGVIRLSIADALRSY